MNRNSIGDKIKYMRQRKNLYPYAPATKAGIAQSTLSCIAKGARQPRFEARLAPFTTLDITTLELSPCSTRRQPCALLSRKTPGASLLFGYTQPSGIWLRWLSAKEFAAVNALSVCESENLI